MKASVNAKEFNRMLKTAGKYVDKYYEPLAGKIALLVHDGKFEIIVVSFNDSHTAHSTETVLRLWADAGDVYNDDFELVPAKDGFCVVSLKALAPLKNVEKGAEIVIESQKDAVTVTAPGFAFDAQIALPPDEFPEFNGPKGDPAETLEIAPGDCDCFKYIIPALSQDAPRPDFTGAVLREGALVATDGRRLHYSPLAALFGTGTLTGIIAPDLLRFIADGHAGTLKEYTEAGECEEMCGTKRIKVTKTLAAWHVLEGPGFSFKSKPISGLFPDFFKVMPNYKADETAEIDAEAFVKAIKPLYAGWKRGLLIALRDCPDGVKVECHGRPGVNSPEQPPRTAIVKGVKLPKLPVGINPEYVIDALNGVNGTVEFCCIDQDSPVWIGVRDSHGGFGRGAVIMPMQI